VCFSPDKQRTRELRSATARDEPKTKNDVVVIIVLLLFGLKPKPPFSLLARRACVGTPTNTRTPPPPSRVLIVRVTRTFSFLGAVTRRVRGGRDRHDVIFSIGGIDTQRKRGNNVIKMYKKKYIYKFQFHMTV
jgi:hypothetical protein